MHHEENHPQRVGNILAETEVSLTRLLDLLSQAYLDATVDADEDIYIRDGLQIPTWIRVLPEKRLIKFFTHMSFGSSTCETDGLTELANRLNSDIAVPVFFAAGDRIHANYFISFAGGIAKGQLVGMLRRFSAAFEYGIRMVDMPAADCSEASASRRLHS